MVRHGWTLVPPFSAGGKSRAQATNDMAIFAVGLSCSFGAAALLQRLDWQLRNTLGQ
ncbi:hypothetical protein ACIPW4_03745 [Pseudomonas sp. NPDC089996]|uniref:hypothetical protein n=1 Tax=Pseudomonas sp. NPDC089996 TaxID=3364474 RepID=UPI003818405A